MFRKSIFGRLLFFTTALLLICLLFIGTLLFSFMGDYLTKQNEKELLDAGLKIGSSTQKIIEKQNVLDKNIFKLTLDVLSSSTNAFIYILDENGNVVINSGDSASFTVRREFYQDVFTKGENVKYIGNLGGIFKTTMLTIGQPIKNGDKVLGAVFLSMAVPEIQQIRSDILQIFLTVTFFVLIIALVFNYVMSRYITKPLSQLRDAARTIAAGNFKERVEFKNTTNEIEELGDTFNFMADSIEQLENMRQSFVSNVSHELRTPMTTIIGFIEGIMDGTIPPEKHQQYLSIVLDESRRLSRLVSDLLDLSRMENGKLQLDIKEFDINEMVRLAIIKMEKRIASKDIKLTVNFQTDNLYALADKDSIARVLTNILDNAIKFTPQGGFIDIKTGKEHGKIYTSITNSGIGIAKEDIMHVFDRFYKSDKSRSLDKSGVGLGLYMVKSLLLAHGENIWAESEPNEYARFTFTLKPKE